MSKEIQSMTDPNTVVLLRANGVYHSIEIDEDHDQLSLRSFDVAALDEQTQSWNYADFDERSELLLAAFKEIDHRVEARRTQLAEDARDHEAE